VFFWHTNRKSSDPSRKNVAELLICVCGVWNSLSSVLCCYCGVTLLVTRSAQCETFRQINIRPTLSQASWTAGQWPHFSRLAVCAPHMLLLSLFYFPAFCFFPGINEIEQLYEARQVTLTINHHCHDYIITFHLVSHLLRTTAAPY